MRTRVAAWLITGPLGHLAASVVDWVALLARYVWARARGKMAASERRRV